MYNDFNINNMKFTRRARNIRLASILLQGSNFLKKFVQGKRQVYIDYDGISTLDELFEGNPKGKDVLKKTYRIPISFELKNGYTGKIDAVFDDVGKCIKSIPYYDFNTIPIDAYEELAAGLDDNQNKEGYTPEEKNEISKKEQEAAIAARERQHGKNLESFTYINMKEEEASDEEEKEPVLEPTIPIQDETTTEGTQEDKQEEEQDKELEAVKNVSWIRDDKMARAIACSGVSPDQVQNVTFVPHPQDFNELLAGGYLLNNHQELIIIEQKGGGAGDRFVFVQGSSENNYEKVETLGRYNDQVKEYVPEYSSIGANVYNTQDVDDNVIDSKIVEFECDGKAERIDFTKVPTNERMDIIQKAAMYAAIEKILADFEADKARAENISDDVERNKALAEAHDKASTALMQENIPGDDDDRIIKSIDAEKDEHLKEAEEAEKQAAEEAEEKAKAEAEEQAAAEAEQEEGEQTEPKDDPSAASKVMFGIGATAVGVAVAGALEGNDDKAQDDKAQKQENKQNGWDWTPGASYEDYQRGIKDPNRPY